MDYLLVDGDLVFFESSFEAATVFVFGRPGMVTASGQATFGGKKLCIVGDEKSVKVSGCPYTTPSNPIPGTGTLEIAGLAGDQRSTTLTLSRAKVLLAGSRFFAKFTVGSPAHQQTPTGPVFDQGKQYWGRGRFITTNTRFRGS